MHVVRGINSRYWKECTGFHVCLFVYTGFWPLLETETNRFLKLMKGFPYFALCGMIVTLIIGIYDLTFKLNDYILISESLVFNISLIKSIFILSIAIFKISDIVSIFSALEAFTPQDFDERERFIFSRAVDRAVRYTTTTVSIWALFALVFNISPLFEEVRRHPMHFNLPLESPLFEISYIGAILSGQGVMLTMSFFDSFVVSAYIVFSTFLEILQYKIERGRHFALLRMEKNLVSGYSAGLPGILGGVATEKRLLSDRIIVLEVDIDDDESHVEEGEEVQSGARSLVNDQSDPRISIISAATNPESRVIQIELQDQESEDGQPDQESEEGFGVYETTPEMRKLLENVMRNPELRRELDVQMRRHLGECVMLHYDLLKVIGDTQQRADLVLFLALVSSAVVLCLSMFITVQVPFGSVDMILWGFSLIMMLQQLYGYCWVSSRLQEESVRVSDALYYSDWTEASLSYKRSMLIMMTRAVRPVEISTMGFLTFDMEMFRQVTNSAYSYFKVITTMHQTHK